MKCTLSSDDLFAAVRFGDVPPVRLKPVYGKLRQKPVMISNVKKSVLEDHKTLESSASDKKENRQKYCKGSCG